MCEAYPSLGKFTRRTKGVVLPTESTWLIEAGRRDGEKNLIISLAKSQRGQKHTSGAVWWSGALEGDDRWGSWSASLTLFWYCVYCMKNHNACSWDDYWEQWTRVLDTFSMLLDSVCLLRESTWATTATDSVICNFGHMHARIQFILRIQHHSTLTTRIVSPPPNTKLAFLWILCVVLITHRSLLKFPTLNALLWHVIE